MPPPPTRLRATWPPRRRIRAPQRRIRPSSSSRPSPCSSRRPCSSRLLTSSRLRPTSSRPPISSRPQLPHRATVAAFPAGITALATARRRPPTRAAALAVHRAMAPRLLPHRSSTVRTHPTRACSRHKASTASALTRRPHMEPGRRILAWTRAMLVSRGARRRPSVAEDADDADSESAPMSPVARGSTRSLRRALREAFESGLGSLPKIALRLWRRPWCERRCRVAPPRGA
mmetsp:Transcript_92856/g.206532  ORF Transcript_92856/g.206532 Transcript_92856/m.206532 type:complete len:231 (-) Transcript_92856:32-724(-)